jgi:hypothetical protein
MKTSLRFATLGLFLLCAPTAWAEVKIDAACRIKNKPPGRCGWCALETLGRHHKIKALYGLTEEHASTCDADSLMAVLTDKGVTYRVQHEGDRNDEILHDAIRQNLGAVVGFRELKPGAGGHIVTLIDMTEDTVKVIDSNDKDGRTRTMTIERFLYWWDGFALVVEPKSAKESTVIARSDPAPSRK